MDKLEQSDKKQYETPALIVHGSVEQITQNVFKLGTGDTALGGVLQGILAAS